MKVITMKFKKNNYKKKLSKEDRQHPAIKSMMADRQIGYKFPIETYQEAFHLKEEQRKKK